LEIELGLGLRDDDYDGTLNDSFVDSTTYFVLSITLTYFAFL
jgi:hypothetical protein